ncbi:unnamed protein product [Paramecium primaurelia]|uniref:Uncharacterized protein n=1 Tax=Paramecium primaurelia TaxID=5886 RepID=A0A8S1Q0V9_PARPR|nr:unnamed protein product [Paramecium primaurelia]
MYRESEQEQIKSQWVRQILMSNDSKIVAIKYQEQWLLYNLIEKKSKILIFQRCGPGMFSPDSLYFIAVGVNFSEQKETVLLIKLIPHFENPLQLMSLENQVKCLDINEQSNKLLLNLMNGSFVIWDIHTKQQVLQLNQNTRFDFTQFCNNRIIGTQPHCITYFDQVRMKQIKRIFVSGRLSEYQKYSHYCDVKQITSCLILFRQSRGMEKFCYRIINNQSGKMIRIFRDCQRFENLNINVSPDHKRFARLSKIQNTQIELLEIDSGKSYNFINCLDTKQPICFSCDWTIIIQSTKHGYAKVYRKIE